MTLLRLTRRDLRADLIAGMTGAVAGAPQAMGFALIAGISPIYGIYTAIVATLIASLTGSSSFMTVAPTNALALVVGSTLIQINDADQISALFMLTFLVGVFQLFFGLFRLDHLTRFVSSAVMTGFITGAGLLILIGQLDHLTGYETEGAGGIFHLVNWLVNLPQSDPQTTVIGLISIVIIAGLHHTRIGGFSTLLAIIVTTAWVLLMGWTDVALVRDMSPIPSSLPGFEWLDFSMASELVFAGLAMAVLGSVQSAAILQTTPERNGEQPGVSRDFMSQGLANIVSSFFQGMPACGSLSRTAVNLSSGARTRWANIFSALFVAAILLALGPLIEAVTLAVLAGHLVVAAWSLFKWDAILLNWRVNYSARLAMVSTFVATMVLPLEYSIYIGVVISIALYLYTSTTDLHLTQLIPMSDHHFREGPVPARTLDYKPMILSLHGNLYFAAVERLEKMMPDPSTSTRPVVILRLRDNKYLGSMGIIFLEKYAHRLRQRGGRLILSGIGPELRAQLEQTHSMSHFGKENIFFAEDIIFKATETAYVEAEHWLTQQRPARQAAAG